MSFENLPLWGNAVVLAVGSTVVWFGGTRLSLGADTIAKRLGYSRALAGALLLGGATSLPEIATTVTASHLGNASLAVNNLFGGVAMQLAVLAVIDFLFVRGALTFFSPQPVLLLGGVLLILQIALALSAIAAGDFAILGHVGVWPLLLVGVYVLSLYFMERFTDRQSWVPSELPPGAEENLSESSAAHEQYASWSSVQLFLLFAGNCALVLVGGWAVSNAADTLSVQTGIGSGFIGATLVAVATSLPELSTTAGAIRLGAYTMAMANIFGTNTLEVALLFASDVAYAAEPVINAVDDSAVLMGSLAIAMTAVYLWGLLERRDQTILRMGVDSAFVLLMYAIGLGVLYAIAT
ncbi:MAG: hypothetical protein DWQ37_19580 [Planctomycetota bacterium]|nr:MAG: hypothetical protein DWQ37_19580 [Planctomycetota bacterium]